MEGVANTLQGVNALDAGSPAHINPGAPRNNRPPPADGGAQGGPQDGRLPPLEVQQPGQNGQGRIPREGRNLGPPANMNDVSPPVRGNRRERAVDPTALRQAQFGTIIQRNYPPLSTTDEGYWWRRKMVEEGFASPTQADWELDRIPFL